MKFSTLFLVPLTVLFCAAGAQAASMNHTNVVRDYTDTVAPAEQKAYEDSVKTYNQCMSQHGFKFTWTAWSHVTGNTYMYSYVSDPSTWADFDTMHATGGVCDAVWESAVNPHLVSETSAFMVGMPELGHMPKGMGLGSGLIDVTYFKLKGGHEARETFTSTLKMIAEAAEKTHWPAYYQVASVQDAGPGAPDFIVVWGSKNWAEFGKDIDPPLWKMVENAYGKKKADEMRMSLNNVIMDTSSHVDSYNSDLTYKPSGK